jgi:hypothetical protein
MDFAIATIVVVPRLPVQQSLEPHVSEKKPDDDNSVRETTASNKREQYQHGNSINIR